MSSTFGADPIASGEPDPAVPVEQHDEEEDDALDARKDSKRPRSTKPEAAYDLGYYLDRDCETCQKLHKMKVGKELVKRSDDEFYVNPDDDFGDDEELMLRVIHCRRTMYLSSGLAPNCAPGYDANGGVLNEFHYRDDPDFEQLRDRAVEFVIGKYNGKEARLSFREYLNVSTQPVGCRLRFFVTLEAFDHLDNDRLKTYEIIASTDGNLSYDVSNYMVFRELAGNELLPTHDFIASQKTMLEERRKVLEEPMT